MIVDGGDTVAKGIAELLLAENGREVSDAPLSLEQNTGSTDGLERSSSTDLQEILKGGGRERGVIRDDMNNEFEAEKLGERKNGFRFKTVRLDAASGIGQNGLRVRALAKRGEFLE